MAPELIVGPRDVLARHVVTDLARALAAAPPERPFTLAVPGGSVARAFFPALASSGIDWTRVAVLFVDERAVPPDSPESNFALAHALWLAPAGVPPAHVHRMPAEHEPIAAAADAYAATLGALAGTPPRLDYVLLGVGDDGHVASVFAGDAAFEQTLESTVAWTTRAPKPPPARMTLTLPTLARATQVVIAAFGADKAAVVGQAVRGGEGGTPLAQLLRDATRSRLLLDEDAAAALH
ncbi:MAG TPA: 6-phosphogluconolactonase [Gemmatimonadaceae bacterium]|nr:6-phosphogluconolactonase [Gemmatimonadaceae bacterium]